MFSSRLAIRCSALLLLSAVALAYGGWRWSCLPNFEPDALWSWWWWGFFAVEMLALCSELWGNVLLMRNPPDRSAEALEQQTKLLRLSRVDRPAIDVFITVCGESVDVVEDTIDDVLSAAQQYGGRIVVYVLDDSKPSELEFPVELLCDSFRTRNQPVHYENRNRHADRNHGGFKGGNLQNGFLRTEPLSPNGCNLFGERVGQYLLMLDADCRVKPEFFDWTVGLLEFDEMKRIAVVQTPQIYRNSDPVAHSLLFPAGCPDEQSFFMRCVQVYRDAWGAAFSVGSGCLVRRSALRAIDGFPRSTITEDMELSFRLLAAGHRTIWLNEVLAYSTAPVNVSKFLTQRVRWCIGTLQHVGLPHGPFRGNFSLQQRWLYLDGILHWTSFLLLPLVLLAPAIFLFSGVPAIPNESDAFVWFICGRLALRSCMMYVISSYLLPPMVTTIWKSIVSFHIAVALLKAFFFGSELEFKVTGTEAQRDVLSIHWTPLLPSATVLLITLAGCLWCVLDCGPVSQLRPLDWIWTAWAMLICLFSCLACVELPRADDDVANCQHVEQSNIGQILAGLVTRLFVDPLDTPSLGSLMSRKNTYDSDS